MQMKCIDVFTGADGRREYRLQYLVEQTAPVIFKLGRRYDLVEPEGIRSQLASTPAQITASELLPLKPERGSLLVIKSADLPDAVIEELRKLAYAGEYHVFIGDFDVQVLSDGELAEIGLQRVSADKKAKAS